MNRIRSLALVVICSIMIACGGGSSTSTSTPTTTPQPTTTTTPQAPATLMIVSLAETQATPFTPLAVTTSGFNADPITVTFSNGAGFTATSPVISAGTNIVTIPIPIYDNPLTNTDSQGTVSIVLTQDKVSTAPVTFTILDLPVLSTYGSTITAGQVTDAFLVYENIVLGHQLDEMQTIAIAESSNAKIAGEAASAAATLYSSVIPAANGARNDVDLVMATPTKTFPWGTSPSGAAWQFDSTQLSFMDRVAAAYLVQQFSTTPTVAAAIHRRALLTKNATTTETVLETIMGLIKTGNSVDELTEDLRESPNSSASSAMAFMDSLEMISESQDAEQFSSYVGMVSGLAHFGEAVNTELNLVLPGAWCMASQNCNEATASEISSEMTNAGINVANADFSLMAKLPDVLGLENYAASTTSELLTGTVNLYNLEQSGSLQNVGQAALDAVNSTSFGAVLANLGAVSGQLNINNSLGAAASLTAVQLQQCAPGTCTSTFDVTELADAGGSYDLVIPLDITGVNYGTMDIVGFDILTNTGLATEAVNLTAITPNATVSVPTMSGVCNDTDYGAPDGDDPDCD